MLENTTKYNLTEIYFDINYTTSVMAESVSKVMDYNTLLFTYDAMIQNCSEDRKSTLVSLKRNLFEEYIEFLKSRISILEKDMEIVKTTLLTFHEFKK